MQGDDAGVGHCGGDLDCFLRGQGEVVGPDGGDARGSQEEERTADWKAASDVFDGHVPNGVAGDIDGGFRFRGRGEDEADYRAAAGFGGTVARGCGGDNDFRDSDGFPRVESERVAAEAFGAGFGGKDAPGAREKAAAGVVEVVEVVIVTEQDGVYEGQGFGGYGRARGSFENVGAGMEFGARGIEGGIGKEGQAGELDEHGGAAAANRPGRRRCHAVRTSAERNLKRTNRKGTDSMNETPRSEAAEDSSLLLDPKHSRR